MNLLVAHAARLGHSPWEFHVHPDVLLLIAVVVAAYAWMTTRWRPEDVVAERKHPIRFGIAIGLLWIISDWPIHDLSEGWSYSVHMVQHLILTFVIPPIALWGMPAWMLRRLIAPIEPLVRFMTRPLPALLAFNVAVAFTHWTYLTNLAVRSGPAHLAQHTLLVVTALLMWWPVVGPLPEYPRLSPLAAMLYLFIQSLVPTVPASFLTFATEPIYRAYVSFPKPWGLTPTEDQTMAGGIMKIGGAALLWSVIGMIWFRWAAREGARQQDERRAAGRAILAKAAERSSSSG